MAGISRSRSHAVDDVVDEADTAPREEKKTHSGKKIKAIPFSNGTTVIVRNVDFEKVGVKHANVTWDYRIDNFTVTVGEGITEEAACALVNHFPDSFQFV